MKPYSKDLRVRVLAAVDGGMVREEVAKTFSVSVPAINRWLKRRRESGDVEPKPIPGRPSVKGTALEGWLAWHLEKNPDLTLEEHREAFEEARGDVRVSRATVGRAIARLPGGGWPIKKVARSPRARRGGEGSVAVVGFSLRRPAASVCGRKRVSHLLDAPLCTGAQGKEGLRQGPAQPGQEHYSHRFDHPRRRYGRIGGHRGRHGCQSLRGLRGALSGAFAQRRAGGGARQARGTQDREGQRSCRGQRRTAPVLAVLLTGPESHRGSFQQDQGHCAQSRRTYPRGTSRSDSSSIGSRHARRCGGLVRPRRLRVTGSIFMSTAVGVGNAGAARSTTPNDAAGTDSLGHLLSRSSLGACCFYYKS